MAGLGQTSRKDLVDFIFKGTALTSKAINSGGTYWVTLHTGDPGVDGQTSNEVGAGVGYSAKATTSSDWSSGTTASPTTETSNATVFNFGPASGAGFGTVTYFGIWNHATLRAAANFVGANTCTSQTVASGNTLSFPIGSLKFQVTG